jgi:hypothetical protein
VHRIGPKSREFAVLQPPAFPVGAETPLSTVYSKNRAPCRAQGAAVGTDPGGDTGGGKFSHENEASIPWTRRVVRESLFHKGSPGIGGNPVIAPAPQGIVLRPGLFARAPMKKTKTSPPPSLNACDLLRLIRSFQRRGGGVGCFGMYSGLCGCRSCTWEKFCIDWTRQTGASPEGEKPDLALGPGKG